MDNSTFDRIKEWFDNYLKEYFEKATDKDLTESFSLKKDHTFRVVENIQNIAHALGLEDARINIARVIALFHDIGRFPQYLKYRTFKDADSVNHGVLSAEIIKEADILKHIPEKAREVIITAIKFHNALSIPDLPKKDLLFLRLIRDADKLDIWRTFSEYLSLPSKDRPSGAFLGLPDTEEASEEIVRSLKERRIASLKHATNINDFRLIQLSWVFDLNFRESFRMIKDRGDLYQIANISNPNQEVKEAIDDVFGYIEKRANPKVYFIGAGPGDPELITIKGRRLLDEADVIIYAGSLVNPTLLDGTKAEIYNSATMTLNEIIEIIKDSFLEGKTVARLHTGDPSIYSAISEQIERLRPLNIEYEIVPGVSSAIAGASVLGQELTIPEISQTVIFTRLEGRTPVPGKEKLGELARHRATMVIFLSVGMIERVKEELLQGYPEDTPVAIVEKATWPEERIIRGKLKELDILVIDAGIKKTALIYVGETLKASLEPTGKESRLYNREFKHGFRL